MMHHLTNAVVCGARSPFVRVFSSAASVAVVGSGPAGYYTAQQLLKGHSKVHVDIYEKLPVPFGLVRYGVAPDHPEVKNVINTFNQTAKNDRCHFFGSVSVGRDVSLTELQNAYTAVVLAYGAEDDKVLGIPGEDLDSVLSARAFVGWYNGLPTCSYLQPDLDTDTAVILGQGNVAVDVARMLLTPVDDLKKTDITEYALEALTRSRVRRVYLVGRRGPLQAAFTIAELRELVKLPQCRPVFSTADFAGFENHIEDIPRPRKRMMELMMKTASTQPVNKVEMRKWTEARKQWHLTFLRSPVAISAQKDTTRVGSIFLAVNRLQGPLGEDQKAVPTRQHETIQCGLVFRSIGYKSCPLDAATPFDKRAAVVPNQNGRVKGHPGLYCSGWIKRGPVGVLATTMTDAFETGKIIVDDLKSGNHAPSHTPAGRQMVLELLTQKGITPVSFSDWEKIDAVERSRGEERGKPREKIVDIDEMLHIAHS